MPKMGTRHMVSNSKVFEPQRSNNFEVQFVETNAESSLATGVTESLNLNNITLCVATYSAPQINISPITVSYQNNSIKFAGKPEFPESSITINDYIGLDIENTLMNWYKKVYNPGTEQIGYAVNYKKDAYLHELAPNGSVDRMWHLYGVWPSSINLGEFSQENSAVRQITMTLQYDYCVPVDTGFRGTTSDTTTNYNG